MGKSCAVILAGGTGERAGYNKPKQFMKVAGKSILEHTLDVFEKHKGIDEIFLVVNMEFRYLAEDIIEKNNYKKIRKLLNGGATRRESSFIGISAIESDDSKVIIHDSVRPFVSFRIIDDCLSALDTYDAVDVAISSADTIIQVNSSSIIDSIPPRKNMFRGQTPQAFRLRLIKEAHRVAPSNDEFTDDCGLIVKYNLAPVFVVRGEEQNFKITYPEDIYLADKIFQMRNTDVPEGSIEGIRDKVLVVFGGTDGIGLGISRMAEACGAKVHCFSRRNGVDITDPGSVAKSLADVYEIYGKIHYVVNTAGVLSMGKLTSQDVGDMLRDVMINYMGAIYVAKSSIPFLKESQGGLLLFTSSSYTKGRSLYSVYSSSKAAIVNLTQALAEECAIDGVRVNVINPERTATPMRFKNFGHEPEDTLLSPDIVAHASLQTLLSDITGQIIDVRKTNSGNSTF